MPCKPLTKREALRLLAVSLDAPDRELPAEVVEAMHDALWGDLDIADPTRSAWDILLECVARANPK